MMEEYVELQPIKDTHAEFDRIEAIIKEHFKREIYLPLLAVIGKPKAILNEGDEIKSIHQALQEGRITFRQGIFSGKFSASITRVLKKIGARWDRRLQVFRIQLGDLPSDLRSSIALSEQKFQDKLTQIDRYLDHISPVDLAGRIKTAEMFDKTLFRVDKEFRENVRLIGIQPTLTPFQRKKIADEWQTNMELWIKDFTEEEIEKLRGNVKKTLFKGDRYGSLVKTIQESFGVSANKAKFLARQETRLLTSKYQAARYDEAGVPGYLWRDVGGTPEHPVRPRHHQLSEESKAGKIFYWSDPPVTTEAGEPQRKNNPGGDYNCRCFAIPVIAKRQVEALRR
jgi:SPP1 gp7 family putative phage head morphogenesis protein